MKEIHGDKWSAEYKQFIIDMEARSNERQQKEARERQEKEDAKKKAEAEAKEQEARKRAILAEQIRIERERFAMVTTSACNYQGTVHHHHSLLIKYNML